MHLMIPIAWRLVQLLELLNRYKTANVTQGQKVLFHLYQADAGSSNMETKQCSHRRFSFTCTRQMLAPQIWKRNNAPIDQAIIM